MYKFANAPCSWGVIEGNPWSNITFDCFLDEVAESGYEGVELGPYGFLPTDPVLLKEELSKRKLSLIGSWVETSFHLKTHREDDIRRAVTQAKLMQAVSGLEGVIVFGGNVTEASRRNAVAARVKKENQMDEETWKIFVESAHMCAKAVTEETGISCTFHPHGGTWIESRDEVDKLARLSDPSLVNLCVDTGHLTFGGSDPVDIIVQLKDRIKLIHFKDCSGEVLERVKREKLNYTEAIAKQVYCPMGEGLVDFAKVLKTLKDIGYEGWITVEQDVPPDGGSPLKSATENHRYIKRLLNSVN